MNFLIRPLSRYASAGGLVTCKIWIEKRDKVGKTDDRWVGWAINQLINQSINQLINPLINLLKRF